MRVLLTSFGSSSHIRPLAPLYQALRHQGHTVALATAADCGAEAATYGMDHLAAGMGRLTVIERLARRGKLRRPRLGRTEGWAERQLDMTEMFVRESAPAMAEDVRACAERFQPDLVVRTSMEFGGYLAAEQLGLPHATVDVSGRCLDPAVVLPALDELRRERALPADPGGERLHPWLRAVLVPPSWEPAHYGGPTVRAYRHEQPTRTADALPGWVAELPTGRPLVLAALGTVAPAFGEPARDLFALITAALSGLDVNAVVCTGSIDPAAVPTGSPHVRVVRGIAQPLLLESCDLFLTHGGFGSVREAVRAGVPMVVTPVFAEQPENAERVEANGVGRALPLPGLTEGALRTACVDVLETPGYRQQARHWQRRMLALPPLDRLVTDLEQIAAGKQVDGEAQE